jgi:hypothetical protein
MRRPFSREKSLWQREVHAAIGRQLRESYKVAYPLSDRLADLMKKIEYGQSSHETTGPSQPAKDA